MAARDRQISSLYTQALRFGNVTLEKKKLNRHPSVFGTK
jgi:hypothetical protein